MKPIIERVAIRAGIGGFLLSIAAGALLNASLEQVPTGMVGVLIDGTRGVLPRIFDSGRHWIAPGGRQLVLLPEGTRDAIFGLGEGQRPLEIRTSDDQTARVAATALWRMTPGRAWSIVAAGLDLGLPERVRDVIEDVSRTEFARLGSGDWFDVSARRSVLDDLRPLLSDALARLEVELVDLILLDVEFSTEYTKKLQQKQAAVQKIRRTEASDEVERLTLSLDQLRQEASTELARVLNASSLARAERQASVHRDLDGQVAEAQNAAMARRLQADLDLAEATTAGRAALDQATADAQRQHLEVLAREGGRDYLTFRAAQSLHFDRVVLESGAEGVPSILDLDELQRLLGGK